MNPVLPSVHGSCPQRVRVRESVATVHVMVCGEVDLCTAPALEDVLEGHLGRGQQVIVDLSQVAFADGSALRVLLRACRRDPDLQLFAPSRSVRRLLRLAGVSLPHYAAEVFGHPGAH